MASIQSSPFLDVGSCAKADALAVLHLKRDLQLPIVLREQDDQNQGYDEGKVTNTRFGSFPHSTLIGVPWGSQIRASEVDTGSRGRRAPEGKVIKGQKRKREADTPDTATPTDDKSGDDVTPKVAVVASTGFVHILPPTPESWTTSLPHRTQVVYTPDYSYILQRLRARPGTVIIEAGAGSGSFTHAAARAVYSGRPDGMAEDVSHRHPHKARKGKVWSFEFHEQRVERLTTEIREHGLEGIVEVTHRDVCQDGFTSTSIDDADSEQAIYAEAVFLDLPAPWLALKHLSRNPPESDIVQKSQEQDLADFGTNVPSVLNETLGRPKVRKTPLNPRAAVRLCTFSPCIEQVQRTVTTLRQLGWLEIEMVEIAAKRIEVRRERVGLQEEGLRGVNASPASVDEALARLREIEGRFKTFHEDAVHIGSPRKAVDTDSPPGSGTNISKQQRLESIRDALADRKLYKEGRLIHRPEAELKTHTSYLVFAILPQDWTVEDEQKAHQNWSTKVKIVENNDKNLSRRQMKRVAKAVAGGNKAFEEMHNVDGEVPPDQS
ncbi:tRNA (adenine-N(1)-)-methyltransferase catalytic subunit trm61 [Lignoscripta atroalba]|nr:tRNA (adenine-N(1)-)-methyltransferase catalytic subunit trm61 [Lignoscripta atroalba]